MVTNALGVGAGTLSRRSNEIWLLGAVFDAEKDSAPVGPIGRAVFRSV